MTIKPIKDFGNQAAYWELMRSVNPHLPKAEFVTTDEVVLRAGPEQMATLTFTTFITLPDLDKLYAVLNEAEQVDVEHAMDTLSATYVDPRVLEQRFHWPCGCVTITPAGAIGPSEMHVHAYTCRFHTPIKENPDV